MTSDAFVEEYERLPEAIRQYYSFKEYCWMTDRQRATILTDNCEPDYEEP